MRLRQRRGALTARKVKSERCEAGDVASGRNGEAARRRRVPNAFEDENDDEYEDDGLDSGFAICYWLFVIALRCKRSPLGVAQERA